MNEFRFSFGKALLLWLSLSLYGIAVNAAPELVPFTAEYKLKRAGISIAKARFSLKKLDDEGRYVYESHTSSSRWLSWLSRDKLHERSEMRLDDQGIHPIEYRYDHTGGDKERHVRLSFDWEKRRVVNDINDDRWSMDIPPGTLDKFIVQVALMLDVPRQDKELTYQVADGGRLKTYKFTRLEEDRIKTPVGTFRAIRVKRLEDKRQTEFWCAPALGYLPIRVIQRVKGGTYTMTLTKLKGFDIAANR